MNSTKPTKKIVLKILRLLQYGLTAGLGKQKPGEMCVEAAICSAYGLPHGDNPPCVGSAVRSFKIALNDCNWPSKEARAEGMKALAIAQLGSDVLDQMEFGKLMILRGTQEVLPFVFRKEAEKLPAAKKKEMLKWADKLAAVTTFEEARSVSASASASAYLYASASASAYLYASASACAYAYLHASACAYASAYAYAYLYDLLKLTAAVGLRVLIEMKSPGCKWLSLVEDSSVPAASETVTAYF